MEHYIAMIREPAAFLGVTLAWFKVYEIWGVSFCRAFDTQIDRL